MELYLEEKIGCLDININNLEANEPDKIILQEGRNELTCEQKYLLIKNNIKITQEIFQQIIDSLNDSDLDLDKYHNINLESQ